MCEHRRVVRRGVRVIAGTERGRRLQVPPGDLVRPTSDRVKEAVFSALDARGLVTGATVLDLWAGSGALAVEALSRGAERAVLVELEESAVEAIRQNVERCGLGGRARVVRSEVARFVAGAAAPEAPFDLILADPPYDADRGALCDVLRALVAGGLTEEGVHLVLELPASGARDFPGPWRVVWDRAFGDTLVLFLTA